MNKTPSFFLSFFLVFFVVSHGFAAGSQVATYKGLLQAIRQTRAASQARIEAAVEQEKVREAWETGKLIDEHVLQHKERADYGKYVIERLAGDLGVDHTELYRMLEFARAYPIVVPSRQLSWSHYQALLALNDSKEREEFAEEAVRQGWNRNKIREEIRRRQSRTQASETLIELPEITPGPLYTYPITRLKDRLKIDLGFGIYHEISEADSEKFKEGEIVQIVTSHLSLVTKDVSLSDLFTYPALVTQVVDGDTFHALIDLGFGVTVAERVRLRRIDAPDVLTAEGKEAKVYLEKILFRDKGRIILQSHNLDQHGRPLADVWVCARTMGDECGSVDQELLDEELAVKIGN